MTSVPEAVLIAGANGAGKTTFAREYLQVRYPGATFLNADEIQREGAGFDHPVAAGRELVRRLAELVAQRQTFAVETTLSSRSYVSKLRSWLLPVTARAFTSSSFRRLTSQWGGWQRGLLPAGTRSRRRTFGVDLIEAFASFRRSTSRWWIAGIIGAATTKDFDLTTTTANNRKDPELELMIEAARRATWDALHGPRHLRSGRFRPVAGDGQEPDATAQLDDAADGASRRS